MPGQVSFAAVGAFTSRPSWPALAVVAASWAVVVVVGSEGRGLARLVGQTCDLRVRIPMSSDVESLNASVAAAVTLAEVARRRA